MTHRIVPVLAILAVASAAFLPRATAADKIKVLVIGGQNNHNCARSTPFMEQLLDKAEHIEATAYSTPPRKAPKEQWDAWRPKFKDFDCVVLDYNGEMWPERVKKDFLDYISAGGGAIVIHAANNSFAGWKEYEQMVGMLWRGIDHGCSLYVDEDGAVVREQPGKGRGMGHGSQYDWVMTTRDAEHPVTRGMPEKWLHKHDELYHDQRGPAENVHILLTAYSDPAPDRRGTGKHEPIVWWIPYGKGKVLTNVMGHVGGLGPMQCVGFKVILYRACEWLANGKCTTPLPDNFPTAEKTSIEE